MAADFRMVDLSEDRVEYEVDVVEHACRFGLVHEASFKALSNFKLDIVNEVRAGRYSGYLCNIKLYDEDDLG